LHRTQNQKQMKLFTKTLGFLFAFIIICKSNFSQQIPTVITPDKQLVCQFNSYSVEQDKLLKKEFENLANFKIIFTCIPSGIAVIEGSSKFSESDIELIKQKFNNIHLSYAVNETLTLKDSEAKCATFRSN
jgi:hypothetical protein